MSVMTAYETACPSLVREYVFFSRGLLFENDYHFG